MEIEKRQEELNSISNKRTTLITDAKLNPIETYAIILGETLSWLKYVAPVFGNNNQEVLERFYNDLKEIL